MIETCTSYAPLCMLRRETLRRCGRCASVRHPLAIVLPLLVSIMSCSQPSAGPSHRPSPSKTALSLPLLWIRDDTTASGVQPRYMLMDWTGRRLGTLSLWGQIQQSPDGSRALVDGTTIVDATAGRRL